MTPPPLRTTPFDDPYGRDVLSCDPHSTGPRARRPQSRQVHLEIGMVLEDVSSGWVGAVTVVQKIGGMHTVELEDRKGRRRSFPLGGGFWLEGQPIVALPPRAQAASSQANVHMTTPGGRAVTHSGSIAAPPSAPKVARASRLWVEGKHDADLVQHVWGQDLAEAGVVVQLLEGVDNLEAILEVFAPHDAARAGVLVDHLVPGSKESRIADRLQQRWGDAVLIVGHPYVDIWQAVKPQRVGLAQWPQIPRGTDIKIGTLAHLGWPHANAADIANGWKRILSQVRSYKDLEPALLGRVEELIDFVTAPGTH
ncbi:DUF3097 family protein [Schaalia suimastitidis]|uniref:DUF3097 family protein n=1 Tax=Schaalia suimastitidis TaxID=121163 RepID=UPI000A006B5B|nr:DUF3097 family protein [Schaalia suimastitidis]